MEEEGSQRGFTLIEVVVSLGLLAVMSVMAYQALSVVLDANERSRMAALEPQRLQRTWQIIGRDLWHLRARSFADGLGEIEPPYETDASEFGVRFSRGGTPMLDSNPTGVSRVYYTLNPDHEMVRTTWAITDSPRITDGVQTVLIDEVREVIFEHLSADNVYSRDWPPINIGSRSLLPRMIRVTIELDSGLVTSRLFPGVVSD